MANYYASARSNCFTISQPSEFLEWVDSIPGLVFEPREALHSVSDLRGVLLVEDADGGGWPSYLYDDETGEEREVNIFEEVAPFLAPKEVAIFMEVGSEKLRYLTGYAVAVRSDGEILRVSLDDIYNDVLTEWGDAVNGFSECSY